MREKDLTAPYIYNKDKWIGFDDEISLKLKAKYMILRQLGGIAVWHINEDDPSGKCGYGAFPLLQSIRNVLIQSVDDINIKSNITNYSTYHNYNDTKGVSFVAVIEKYGNVERIVNEEQLPCSKFGYIKHPKECTKFYRCIKFEQNADQVEIFQYSCPVGLVFDERYEICNWPSWSPSCPGSGEIMIANKKKFTCPSYGYFQDPENCEYFYYCSDFGKSFLQAYEFRCPFELAFDEDKLLCNWKWLVRGCKNVNKASLTAAKNLLEQANININSANSELDSTFDELIDRSDNEESGKNKNENSQVDSTGSGTFTQQVSGFIDGIGHRIKSLFFGDKMESRQDAFGLSYDSSNSWLHHLNPFAKVPKLRFRGNTRNQQNKKKNIARPNILSNPVIQDPLITIPIIEIKQNTAPRRQKKKSKRPKRPSHTQVPKSIPKIKPQENIKVIDNQIHFPSNKPISISPNINTMAQVPDVIPIPIITIKEEKPISQQSQKRPVHIEQNHQIKTKNSQKIIPNAHLPKPNEMHQPLNLHLLKMSPLFYPKDPFPFPIDDLIRQQQVLKPIAAPSGRNPVLQVKTTGKPAYFKTTQTLVNIRQTNNQPTKNANELKVKPHQQQSQLPINHVQTFEVKPFDIDEFDLKDVELNPLNLESLIHPSISKENPKYDFGFPARHKPQTHGINSEIHHLRGHNIHDPKNVQKQVVFERKPEQYIHIPLHDLHQHHQQHQHPHHQQQQHPHHQQPQTIPQDRRPMNHPINSHEIDQNKRIVTKPTIKQNIHFPQQSQNIQLQQSEAQIKNNIHKVKPQINYQASTFSQPQIVQPQNVQLNYDNINPYNYQLNIDQNKYSVDSITSIDSENKPIFSTFEQANYFSPSKPKLAPYEPVIPKQVVSSVKPLQLSTTLVPRITKYKITTKSPVFAHSTYPLKNDKKKSQLLIIPVPDDHPNAYTDVQRLSSQYPQLFPFDMTKTKVSSVQYQTSTPTLIHTTKKPYKIAQNVEDNQNYIMLMINNEKQYLEKKNGSSQNNIHDLLKHTESKLYSIETPDVQTLVALVPKDNKTDHLRSTTQQPIIYETIKKEDIDLVTKAPIVIQLEVKHGKSDVVKDILEKVKETINQTHIDGKINKINKTNKETENPKDALSSSLYNSIQEMITKQLLNQNYLYNTLSTIASLRTSSTSTTTSAPTTIELGTSPIITNAGVTSSPLDQLSSFIHNTYQVYNSNETHPNWQYQMPWYHQIPFTSYFQPVYHQPQRIQNQTSNPFQYYPIPPGYAYQPPHGYHPQFLNSNLTSYNWFDLINNANLEEKSTTTNPINYDSNVQSHKNKNSHHNYKIHASSSTTEKDESYITEIPNTTTKKNVHHSTNDYGYGQRFKSTEAPIQDKAETPQIQVYIVQGGSNSHAETQEKKDQTEVKVIFIDSHKKDDQQNVNSETYKVSQDNRASNYHNFDYQTEASLLEPSRPNQDDEYQYLKDNERGHTKDLEYEDETVSEEYESQDLQSKYNHLPTTTKIQSLQNLYNSNIYNKLRNFTDGSIPESVCTRPGLFQHPNDCNRYYECYWDKYINKFTLHLFECPVKLAFDSRIVGCNAPTDPTVCVQY